ncbi:MAG: PH domain-containing protein [Geodermatophilaceae bacterium]|nr:PH domain-containing protein [Geodermatophilaceae bacterium]
MLTIRAHKLRIMAWVLAVVIVGGMLVVGLLLKQSNAGGVTFRTADQLAMIGLGVIIAGGVLILTRPYVRADAAGLVVRNFGGAKHIPWQVVRAVRFSDASPWATLELEDDDALTLLAIQAVDGEAAADATDALRRLLTESRGG